MTLRNPTTVGGKTEAKSAGRKLMAARPHESTLPNRVYPVTTTSVCCVLQMPSRKTKKAERLSRVYFLVNNIQTLNRLPRHARADVIP